MNKRPCKSKDEYHLYSCDEEAEFLKCLEQRKSSPTLRRDEREAFEVLIEESNWLGPGKLQNLS